MLATHRVLTFHFSDSMFPMNPDFSDPFPGLLKVMVCGDAFLSRRKVVVYGGFRHVTSAKGHGLWGALPAYPNRRSKSGFVGRKATANAELKPDSERAVCAMRP